MKVKPKQTFPPIANLTQNCSTGNQRITVIETENEHGETVLTATQNMNAECYEATLTTNGVVQGSCLEKFMAMLPWNRGIQHVKIVPSN